MENEIEYTTMEEELAAPDGMTEEQFEEELMNALQEDGAEYMTSVGDAAMTPELTDAQTAGLLAMTGAWTVFSLVLAVASIVAMWKIFTKAGRAGWKSLIPFYNIYVLLQMIGRPGWWLLLFFIPLVNIVIAVIISIDLAKAFGRSTLFGVVALFLFSVVGYLILAFGKDAYIGPGGNVATPSAPAPSSDAASPAA